MDTGSRSRKSLSIELEAKRAEVAALNGELEKARAEVAELLPLRLKLSLMTDYVRSLSKDLQHEIELKYPLHTRRMNPVYQRRYEEEIKHVKNAQMALMKVED